MRDSELKDLKEEVVRLSNLVNQLGMPKAQFHAKKQDVSALLPCAAMRALIKDKFSVHKQI